MVRSLKLVASVLLLSSDEFFRSSMRELIEVDGLQPVDEVTESEPKADVVVADLDYWPAGWDLRRLRTSFRRTPCVMVSASPWAGPDTTSRLQRGYFLAKPVVPGELSALLATLTGAPQVG